jgi:hypothetical protein
MREPVFTETLQVAIVVRGLEAAMRTYVDAYGIGPWDIHEFNPGRVKDLDRRWHAQQRPEAGRDLPLTRIPRAARSGTASSFA